MKQLCINLDSRPDRAATAWAEFKRVGFMPDKIPGIAGDNKPLAFNQSVYRAMQVAKGDDVFLFEDDVVFDFEPGMLDVPNIPNMLSVHLGCNIMGQWQKPTAYNEDYALLHNCWQSHATYYSAECVAFILANMNPNEISDACPIFDEWFRRHVLPMGRSYVMKPMIAYQRPSFSDIWNTQADYTQCHIDGNRYLASL